MALYYFTFCGFETDPELCIEAIVVPENQQNKGIEETLYLSLVHHAKAKECCRLFWLSTKSEEYRINGQHSSRLAVFRAPVRDKLKECELKEKEQDKQ